MEGPVFVVRLLPPFFGLSATPTILCLSGVRGRVLEDGNFRYSSRILLPVGTLQKHCIRNGAHEREFGVVNNNDVHRVKDCNSGH